MRAVGGIGVLCYLTLTSWVGFGMLEVIAIFTMVMKIDAFVRKTLAPVSDCSLGSCFLISSLVFFRCSILSWIQNANLIGRWVRL